jgi:hypothetical protein
MNTIKLISNNRVKYRRTNEMMRELGKIVNNPITNFVEQENEPSNKLSEYISNKMINKDKIETKVSPEDEYYYKLKERIKNEIKQKGSFNFNLLSEKDRKLLAQKKLYNKIGKNVYNENINNNNNNKVNNNKINKEKINKELNREMKKENFFDDNNEEYNYNNDIDKILNEEDEDIKEIEKGLNDNNNNNNNYEKPSAKQILENVLNKIEFKNQQLIYQNPQFKKIKK